MQTPTERATRLLTHYLRMAWERAGLAWESDNDVEVALIVDSLTGYADDVVERAVEAHRENDPHRYADGSTS